MPGIVAPENKKAPVLPVLFMLYMLVALLLLYAA
jgi:hypothetical protein